MEHLQDPLGPLGQDEEEISLVPAGGLDDLVDPVWLNALAEPICHRVKEDPGRGLAALPVDLLEPVRVKGGPEGIVSGIAETAFQPAGYAGGIAVVAADVWIAEVAAAGDRVDSDIGPIDFGPGHSDRLRKGELPAVGPRDLQFERPGWVAGCKPALLALDLLINLCS